MIFNFYNGSQFDVPLTEELAQEIVIAWHGARIRATGVNVPEKFLVDDALEIQAMPGGHVALVAPGGECSSPLTATQFARVQKEACIHSHLAGLNSTMIQFKNGRIAWVGHEEVLDFQDDGEVLTCDGVVVWDRDSPEDQTLSDMVDMAPWRLSRFLVLD